MSQPKGGLVEELVKIRLLREKNLLAKTSSSVIEESSTYFSKNNDRALADCTGEYRGMFSQFETQQDFINFSKQAFLQMTSEIPDPGNYKLLSKNEITKQIPILQSALFKRQHEIIPPKIILSPSSHQQIPSQQNPLPVFKTPSQSRKPFVNSSKSNDPMVVDEEEDKPKSAFMTARQLYSNNNKKKGINDNLSEEEEEDTRKKGLSDIKSSTTNYHPVTSITNTCGDNNPKKRKKFVPPLKSNDTAEKEEPKQSTKPPTKKKKKDDDDEKKADLSRVFPPDGEIPEELSHLDPRLIETISNEILESGVSISWDDISGLEYAKKSVQEAVIWPMLRPDIFTGLRKPPKGLLLFGPPGTGKTLIGKAIAHESGATFFSISASSLTSKWVGEGEKLVRTLFAMARYFQPSVVFIDEIDSLLSQRSESDADNGSRRLKTEFLIQLDGATTNDDKDRILIVGATNRPEEIDEAVRRRMGKRLYIPLPSKEGRKEMITRLLSKNPHTLSENELNEFVELTNGYSGSDIKNLCGEASLFSVRELGHSIRLASKDELRPIQFKDCVKALKSIRPSVAQSDLERYIEWNKSFGSFEFSENNEQEESSEKMTD